jgi:hypothetical protein
MSTGEENAMKARLVTVLATATALFVLGNGFAGVRADGGHAEPTAAPATVSTVTSTTDTETMLAQINVQPTPAEIAAAMSADASADALQDSSPLADVASAAIGLAPSSRLFDMPYYSFGKVLPRVSRD